MTTNTEIKLVPCPGCGGNGACLTCSGSGDVPDGTAPDTRDGRVVRAEAERAAWRELANILMAVAFDADIGSPDMQRQAIGPWGAVPPSEVIDALRGAAPGSDLAETVRAAVLGRAWRMRGKVAEGTCDYPMCRHRPTTVEQRRDRAGSYTRVGLRRPGESRDAASLNVCEARPTDSECVTWARWVAARFMAGRIQLKTGA